MDKQDALKSEAFIRGRRAGLQSLSPSLNEFAEGTAEHLQWEQGRQSGENYVNDYANQKSRKDDWEDRAEYDRDAVSGGRLRVGS